MPQAGFDCVKSPGFQHRGQMKTAQEQGSHLTWVWTPRRGITSSYSSDPLFKWLVTEGAEGRALSHRRMERKNKTAPPFRRRVPRLRRLRSRDASKLSALADGARCGQDMSDLNAPVNYYCRCCNKDVKKIGFTPTTRQLFLSERSLQEGKKKKKKQNPVSWECR